MGAQRQTDPQAHPGSHRVEGDLLPRIARCSVAAAFRDPAVPPPAVQQGFLAEPHPVFVTLRDGHGKLRGCVGTLRARCGNVAEETWRLAREAAFSDTRFPPVKPDEVAGLRFEVSVLEPLQDVEDASALDPRRYGVVVSTMDGRRGALLPNVEGVDTVAHQLALARRKGGIGPEEHARVQRFSVEHYEG